MIVKIKKLFSVFTAAILAVVTLCNGQAVFATSAGAKETADSIIEFSLHQSGAGSLQEWVDTVFDRWRRYNFGVVYCRTSAI